MSRLADRSLRILSFFLVLTGVPLAALVWLGWQFAQQDRDLELRRQRERLQNAAEFLVRELHTGLQRAERSIRADARNEGDAPGPAAFFQLRDGRIVSRSGVSLPFYPISALPAAADVSLFVQPERLEVDGRCDLAIRTYSSIAAERKGELRAGALMRLARCLRKLGRDGEALEVYGELASAKGTTVAGMPAELVARRERIALLTATGDTAAAHAEQLLLREALSKGTFSIDRGTFEFLVETAALVPESALHLPLALAAERSSARWHGDSCGRHADTVERTVVFTLWCPTTGDILNVMVVPAAEVLEPLRGSAETLGVVAAIEDASGRAVWGGVGTDADVLTRPLSDVGLPWQLGVRVADPQAAAAQISRRRVFAGTGLVLMVVTVAAAAFFVFRAVNRELEMARLQSDFIATVSHEFRTPLTAMTHLTEMLQEGAVSPDRLSQYYGALHRETGRLQRVVEGLLDFKRFESGRQAYRMEWLNAHEAVQQVLDGYAPREDFSRLHASLRADGATIRGDRQALAVAVGNLLDNALKYSAADSKVSISVESHGRMVAISVDDHGVGLDPEEQRRVFRKFVRGRAAREGNVKGTGIGLSIVQAVAKAHGGRVTLHTVPGQGSRFTLWLPLLGGQP